MATINVKDAAGSTVALEKPLAAGQAAMAASRPVVIASDQASIPVASTLTAETTKVIGVTRTADGAGNLLTSTGNALDINIKSGVNVNGSAAAANSAPVTASTEDIARAGIITETAPASDTASSGLNGRLQRIAQRITSLIAQIPAALGRTTQAASLSVVQASFEYETVAASATDQILGATGGVGDYLEGLLCVVATAATSQVQIKDGNGSAITVLPNAVGAGVGTYFVPIGLLTVNATTPGWKITTAAGVSVIGTGKFT